MTSPHIHAHNPITQLEFWRFAHISPYVSQCDQICLVFTYTMRIHSKYRLDKNIYSTHIKRIFTIE